MIGISGQTVTVQRPAGTNRYGDPLPATEHTIDGCVLAPAGSEEQVDGQNQVTGRLTVYAPLDADVAATDRLVLPDGTRWQVDGDPQRYRSPFAGLVLAVGFGVCVITIEKVSG